jgi:hypothetical protein
LIRNDEQDVEINAKGEILCANRCVLAKNSDYFATAFKTPYSEANGEVQFDDIEPKYMAYFIGVAYNHSSIAPVTPPGPSQNPELSSARTPLRDYIEVYKLCDRFVCPTMAQFMIRCICVCIGDNHCALFRSCSDEGLQRTVMTDFAQGYEALDLAHGSQSRLGALLIQYACQAVLASNWERWVDENKVTFGVFLAAVSVYWLKQLGECQSKKWKRKELRSPIHDPVFAEL